MANSGATVQKVFGGPSDQGARDQISSTTQLLPEALVVGSTSRKIRGPKANGHFSIHVRNLTASGATSTMTFWYSNLPDPSETDDTHWIQETLITAIDLTVIGNTFYNVGNVNAEWIRIKTVAVTTAGTLYAYSRVEGSDNR